MSEASYHEALPTRLDKFLANQDDVVSRQSALRMISAKLVIVNGEKCFDADYKLKNGDVVKYRLPDVIKHDIVPIPKKLEIHFEDDHLIVLYKEPGVVVHPAAGHYDETLLHYLLAHTELAITSNELRPGIVHRLDKDTSGLLVVAKTQKALVSLSAQFAAKTAERAYIAICNGTSKQLMGQISKPIARSRHDRQKMAIVANGKKAVTHWKRNIEHSGLTIVNCWLETGRTHQIRVHLAAMGLSVLADNTYGHKFSPLKSISSSLLSAVGELEHQALHAYSLAIEHPETGQKLSYFRPAPAELEKIMFGMLIEGSKDKEKYSNNSLDSSKVTEELRTLLYL